MEFYKAEENRYADMIYRRGGRGGGVLAARTERYLIAGRFLGIVAQLW